MPNTFTWMSLSRFVKWRRQAFPAESVQYAIDTWMYLKDKARAGEARLKAYQDMPGLVVLEIWVQVQAEKVIDPRVEPMQYQ